MIIVLLSVASVNATTLIGGSIQNGDFELPASGKVHISTGQIPSWTVWTEVSGASNDTGVDNGASSRIMFIQPQAAVKNMTDYTINAGDVFTYSLENVLAGRAAVELSLIYDNDGVYTAIAGTTLSLSPVGMIEGSFTALAGEDYIGKMIGIGILSMGNWPKWITPC